MQHLTVTIPDGAERVMIFEDATTRGTSPLYTLIVKTVSGSGVTLPVGSTSLVYSDGTNVNLGLSNKGYVTLNSSAITAYTAVNKDQVLANTSANPITVTLPASPSIGSEVTLLMLEEHGDLTIVLLIEIVNQLILEQII